MKRAIIILPIVLMCTSSCGSEESSAGGLTPEQNASLDKAADNLESQRAQLPAHEEAKNAEKKQPQ